MQCVLEASQIAAGRSPVILPRQEAEPRGMRPFVAHCHLGLGKLYRRTGKRQETGEHLAIATAMYREMDMRFWLERAEAEWGQPRRRRGTNSKTVRLSP